MSAKARGRKTIKQWSAEYDLNWFGQGKMSRIRYDWKLVVEKGSGALFSTSVASPEPETHLINGRPVLLFPNPNSPRNQGKVSRTKFLRIVAWIKQCQQGDLTSLEAVEEVAALLPPASQRISDSTEASKSANLRKTRDSR